MSESESGGEDRASAAPASGDGPRVETDGTVGYPDTGGDLDRRTSWLLVGVLAVCVVGFPVAILAWPPTFLPYRDAYLALGMVPALLLGLVGVWTALRSRRGRR